MWVSKEFMQEIIERFESIHGKCEVAMSLSKDTVHYQRFRSIDATAYLALNLLEDFKQNQQEVKDETVNYK